MQNGRFYLRVLLLACAMVFGTGALGQSQDADSMSVTTRATTITADIDNRIAGTQNQDAKACLRNKKTAVANIKGNVATATDFNSLLSQLNAIAGEVESCTSGPNGGPSKDANAPTTPTQVQQTTDANTPDPEGENPGVVIAPGHDAVGPGVIDEGGGGPDFGGGDIGDDDTNVQPPVIPPPVSPTM